MPKRLRQALVFLSLSGALAPVYGGEIGIAIQNAAINDSDTASGLAYRLEYTRQLNPRLAVDLAMARRTHGVTIEDTDIGKITVVPLSATLRYLTQRQSNMQSWVGVGVAYYVNTLNSPLLTDYDRLQDAASNDQCSINNYDCKYAYDHRINNTVGVHFGLGLDYFFNDRVSVSLSGVYRVANTEFETSRTCSGSDCGTLATESSFDPWDLSGLDVGAAVRYAF